MGCGLNKLEKRDEKRPGNIYSTLKRPQVETKIDVSYEYRFLEFTTLSAGECGPSVHPSTSPHAPVDRWLGGSCCRVDQFTGDACMNPDFAVASGSLKGSDKLK